MHSQRTPIAESRASVDSPHATAARSERRRYASGESVSTTRTPVQSTSSIPAALKLSFRC